MWVAWFGRRPAESEGSIQRGGKERKGETFFPRFSERRFLCALACLDPALWEHEPACVASGGDDEEARRFAGRARRENDRNRDSAWERHRRGRSCSARSAGEGERRARGEAVRGGETDKAKAALKQFRAFRNCVLHSSRFVVRLEMARSATPSKGSPYTRLPKALSTPVARTVVEKEDYSNLFVLDATPSAVPTEAAYASTAPVDAPPAPLSPAAQEEEEMRIFAFEVADSDPELLDDEDDDDDLSPIMAVYDNPHELEQAIQGKITDDSAAKVSRLVPDPLELPLTFAQITGRYYKEVDLTRSCGLCGGKSALTLLRPSPDLSRHSQNKDTPRESVHIRSAFRALAIAGIAHSRIPFRRCFTCGEVDGDHEARNCPVTLVCSSCASRGHFSRVHSPSL